MKLALLGFDSDIESLLAAIASDSQHSIVAACVDDRWRGVVARHVRRGTFVSDWESLLAAKDLDGVLVGRDRPGEPESLKKLVQEGIPLLIVHPVGDPLLALELEMIRSDGKGPLIAYHPGCRHPLWRQVCDWMAAGEAGPLGNVEQIVLERRMADRERPAVTFQLARDADFIRRLLGGLSKVSAMGPSADATNWGNLGLQLAGDSKTLARWSVEPAEGASSARLVLIGTAGRAIVSMSDDERRWSVEIAGQPLSRQTWPDWNEEQAALAALESVRSGSEFDSDWSGICRDLEVADTVELSLRRGRMIELHHETVTEEDTFKGVMAALGCLLVMVVPMVLIGAAILGGLLARPNADGYGGGDRIVAVSAAEGGGEAGGSAQSAAATGVGSRAVEGDPRVSRDLRASAPGNSAGEPVRGRPWWPYFLVAPLLVFLFLQLLRLVFVRKRKASESGAELAAR